MERFGLQRPLSKNKCFLILSLLPVYFIITGLFMQPVDEIFHGIVEIIREPDFLITDYFVIGGVGAAFINAGVLTLICIGIMYALDGRIDQISESIYLCAPNNMSVSRENFSAYAGQEAAAPAGAPQWNAQQPQGPSAPEA